MSVFILLIKPIVIWLVFRISPLNVFTIYDNDDEPYVYYLKSYYNHYRLIFHYSFPI